MNYDDDVQIDDSALDIEWLDQPSLMLRYARHAAAAKKKLDLAKEKFDLVKSKLDKEIRSFPDRFELDKVTDKSVEATMPQQPDYKEASRDVINAQFDLNVANGAVKAIDARKDSLENLVKLHGQQYFAGPRMPRDLTAERSKKEQQRKANQAVGSMTRRT